MPLIESCPISEINMYIIVMFGIAQAVLITVVSLFQGALYTEIPLYTPTMNSKWPNSATEMGLNGQ